MVECMKCGTEFEETDWSDSPCPNCGTLHGYDEGFFAHDVPGFYRRYTRLRELCDSLYAGNSLACDACEYNKMKEEDYSGSCNVNCATKDAIASYRQFVKGEQE